MRQKNTAQKIAAASIQTVQQVQFKLQKLHSNYDIIVENHDDLESSNGKLEKQVSDLKAAAPITTIEKVYNKINQLVIREVKKPGLHGCGF